MVDLGTLGGTPSYASAVNDAGQVVGTSYIPSRAFHAFSWTQADGMVDLGTLGGNSSQAYAENANGEIVGYAYTAHNAMHATLWPVAPGAPSAVSAVPGDGQATVSFTAPAFTGGAAISTYTVSTSPGGATASGANSPITVTGLTNGTSYTFTVTATNAAGTGPASTASNAVTPAVVDTTAPSLLVPQGVVAEATSPAGATVLFTVSATDLVDPNPSVVCSPESGAVFPLGDSPVSCTATDAAGNRSSASFVVQVIDTTAPSLVTPEDVTVDAVSALGAAVLFTATATDLVDPYPSVVGDPASGSMFAIGDTTVICSATDAAGNTTKYSFKVTVLAGAMVIGDVRVALAGLSPSDKATSDKLTQAIKLLDASMGTRLWLDSTHPTVKDGNKVFDNQRDAVRQLRGIRNPEPGIPDAIGRLVGETRVLALIAIDDAASGRPDHLKHAADELKTGDRERNAGHFGAAVGHYRNAWQQAVTA
jgi:probable HAF family extracellular repeat protein